MSILMALWLASAATATPTPAPTARPAPTPESPIMLLERNATAKGGAATGQSLADVAKSVKLKMPAGERKVLTNESIKALAEGVELTTAQPAGKDSRAGAPAGPSEADKASWQARYQEARARVVYYEAEVTRLKSEAAKLERDFYAWDDPVHRDAVIKPEWDKTLVALRDAEQRLEAARSGPDKVVEDARHAGALPGWFRGLPEPSPGPASAPAMRTPRRLPTPTPS